MHGFTAEDLKNRERHEHVGGERRAGQINLNLERRFSNVRVVREALDLLKS